MRVYRTIPLEDQESLELLDKGFGETLRRLDGTSRVRGWTSPRMRLLKSSERKHLHYSDTPWYSSDVIVLRQPAVHSIGQLLLQDGELLPIECEQAALRLFNCTTVVDALDEAHSTVTRFPSSGRIMRVDSPVFLPGRIEGLMAFKIPQLPYSALYVSGSIADAAASAGLVRSGFGLVWEG